MKNYRAPNVHIVRSSNPDLEKHKSKYWLICNKKYILTYILFLPSVFVVGTILISLGHLPKPIPLLLWEYFSDGLLYAHEQRTRKAGLTQIPIIIEYS